MEDSEQTRLILRKIIEDISLPSKLFSGCECFSMHTKILSTATFGQINPQHMVNYGYHDR